MSCECIAHDYFVVARSPRVHEIDFFEEELSVGRTFARSRSSYWYSFAGEMTWGMSVPRQPQHLGYCSERFCTYSQSAATIVQPAATH
jgi:hypothetical protein